MQLLIVVWQIAHMQGQSRCHAWCVWKTSHEPLLTLLDGLLQDHKCTLQSQCVGDSAYLQNAAVKLSRTGVW